MKIGGRKGVPDNEAALYVIKINNINNDVIVGPKEYLGCKEIEIRECNWITDNQNKFMNVLVKLRNTFDPVPAKIQINFEKKTTKIYSRQEILKVAK